MSNDLKITGSRPTYLEMTIAPRRDGGALVAYVTGDAKSGVSENEVPIGPEQVLRLRVSDYSQMTLELV